MNTSFLIEGVAATDTDAITVDGAVVEGEISIGMVFTTCYQFVSPHPSSSQRPDDWVIDQDKAERHAVHLRVAKISAYRRELTHLPRGMTGELVLRAEHAGLAQRGTMLLSVQQPE